MARRLTAFPVRAVVAAWWCLTVLMGTAAPRGVVAVGKATPELEEAVVCAAQAVAWETDPTQAAARAASLTERISALSRRRSRDRTLRTERTAGGYHQSFSF